MIWFRFVLSTLTTVALLDEYARVVAFKQRYTYAFVCFAKMELSARAWYALTAIANNNNKIFAKQKYSS